MSAEQMGIFGGADRSEAEDRDRWCTPPHVIEMARASMGGIDLDVASNERAQGIVQAAEWYSLDVGRDGLELPWAGKVWCNPPYSRGAVDAFASKALAEMERGGVSALVVLVNSSTSAGWWQMLASAARGIVFPNKRLSFWHAETGRTAKGNAYDQTIFLYGACALACWQELGCVISRGQS